MMRPLIRQLRTLPSQSQDWMVVLAWPLQQYVKRGFDGVAALVILLILAPVMVGIALAIKLSDGGPVLYCSERIGRRKQPFSMYKFRTMVVEADRLRDQLRAQENLTGNLFKLEADPRVTAIGRILRKTSLDELPQLLNVLQGTMSLVGPRPLPPDESGMIEAPYSKRFNVLPGITGLWQVSGRSGLSFAQMCQFDFQYVTQWSLWQDLVILVRTPLVVLLQKGAQ